MAFGAGLFVADPDFLLDLYLHEVPQESRHFLQHRFDVLGKGVVLRLRFGQDLIDGEASAFKTAADLRLHSRRIERLDQPRDVGHQLF